MRVFLGPAMSLRPPATLKLFCLTFGLVLGLKAGAGEAASREEITKRLSEEIAAGLKAGEKPTVWASVLGIRGPYPVESADGEKLTVSMQGNPFPLRWGKLAPEELLGIARSFAGEKGSRLLLTAELAAALGFNDRADELLVKAGQADPTLSGKIGELAARLPKDAPRPAPLPTGSDAGNKGGTTATVAAPTGGNTVTVALEEDTTAALRLPDAGLQTRMWSGPKDNYLMRANILYARFTWKDWGSDGRGKVGHYKGWMAKKRYVAFRMYCNTPQDLPDPGLPVATAGANSVPKYWDPKFVEAHKRFVQALGQEIGDNPYLSYIDIGGVGNTGGEWLTYPDDRWGDKPVYRDQGYTPEAKEKLVWELMKIYREAFPHVRLYLAGAGFSYVKDRAALFDYMRKNNIGIRSDGLCWKTVGDGDEWSARKGGQHKLWREVPFQWEGSYSTMEWEKEGWSTAKTMEKAMDFGPISFCYADADRDAVRFEGDPAKVKILDEVGLKLGYRVAITGASYYDTTRPGSTLKLTLTVVNRGVSRIYADRDMEVSFLDPTGKAVAAAKAKPNPSTLEWVPGQELQVTLTVTVPRDTPGGSWQAAIGMLDDDPRRPDTRIEMAMKKRAPENRYILGPIHVR